MTEQYQRIHINNPRGSRGVDVDADLTLDDDLVVADSSVEVINLNLPNAVQVPGNTVYIKAPFGGTNPVNIFGINGQLIDGSPSLVLGSDQSSALFKSDGNNWQAFLGGGSGGFPETQKDGAQIVAATAIYNFTGPGVTVTAGPGNSAVVDISGVAPVQTLTFLDNAITDVPVGTTTTDGCIVVDASISKVNGESTCFRFMFGVSPTGAGVAGFDCLQSDSDQPIQDIVPQSFTSGTTVFLRLDGQGTGVQSGIAYTVRSIARLLP